jgi:preprotein translocase subunit SecG
MLPWWVWLILITIFSLQIYQLVQCGCGGGGAGSGAGGAGSGIDLQALRTSAQTNITIIMVISTIFLALAAYYFLSQNPNEERRYVMIMLHASIFISTISASMAAMTQLSNAD